MLFRQILIPSVLVPLLAALAVVGLGLLTSRRRTPKSPRDLTLAGLALAVGFLASFLALTGPPRWFPVEASQRLFFLVGLAGAWSVFASALQGKAKRQTTLLWLGNCTIWLLALAGLLEPLVRHTWGAPLSVLWLGCLLAVGVLLTWTWSRSLDPEHAGPARAAVRILALGGAALALGLSGTASMAQLCGALAAACAAVEFVGLVTGRSRWRPSHAIVPALALTGLLLIGHFYAELGALPALLLSATVALLGLRGNGWLPVGAPLLPLAAALALVVMGFLDQPEDPYDYYSSFSRQPGNRPPVGSFEAWRTSD